MEKSYCVLLYSKFSDCSTKIMETIKNSNFDLKKLIKLKSVCIDNEQVRKRILNSVDIKVDKVPCILVINEIGDIEKYDNSKAFEWIREILSNLEKTSLSEQPQITNELSIQPQMGMINGGFQQQPNQQIGMMNNGFQQQPNQQMGMINGGFQQPSQQMVMDNEVMQPQMGMINGGFQQPSQQMVMDNEVMQQQTGMINDGFQQPSQQMVMDNEVMQQQTGMINGGEGQSKKSVDKRRQVFDNTDENFEFEEKVIPVKVKKVKKQKYTPIEEIKTDDEENTEENIDLDEYDEQSENIKRIPAIIRSDKNNYEFNDFGDDDEHDKRIISNPKRAIRSDDNRGGVKKKDILSAALELQKSREREEKLTTKVGTDV